jgi:hypothetical protein
MEREREREREKRSSRSETELRSVWIAYETQPKQGQYIPPLLPRKTTSLDSLRYQVSMSQVFIGSLCIRKGSWAIKAKREELWSELKWKKLSEYKVWSGGNLRWSYVQLRQVRRKKRCVWRGSNENRAVVTFYV